ncbi:low molecular weight phosphatase family protein [Kallotenue papyrolyticum]|uniref:arsenate-mycothiol transferase ArsC n=1 Tax=Kallotenue papyrolyticum TaxID=1325125 RepID=UPI000492A1F0|nr:low molecular weight phosphatase family protein [Kallotenue papyrolyticum]
MYQGRPLLLVVGATDTGRAPMVAALLRRALGAEVAVHSAGVLAHQGERAAPEAQMAMDQLGLDLSDHVSRALGEAEHAHADVLLAVDRGTEMVLFTRFPNDRRVTCLSLLADQPDVLDPHRMPLGVWVATAQQLEQQVQRALPELRARLGLSAQNAAETTPPPAAREAWQPIPTTATDPETMFAMLASAPPLASAPEQDAATARAAQDTSPTSVAATKERAAGRAEQVQRMLRLLAIAEEAPEIVDWVRLRDQLLARLRAVAAQPHSGQDLTPAAVLMIEGKLQQCSALPDGAGLLTLKRVIARLEQPVSATDLPGLGQALATW